MTDGTDSDGDEKQQHERASIPLSSPSMLSENNDDNHVENCHGIRYEFKS